MAKRKFIAGAAVAAVLLAAFFFVTREDGEILRNSQAYYDSAHCLENDIPVMIFLLDGFGYMQYEKAAESGHIEYIHGLGNALTAETYMPSISPVGLAAIVTGKGPAANGIKKRGHMDLKVPDIFAKANELGKEAVLIEGGGKLINTSIEPVINVDVNNDGFTDDEVFASASEEIAKGYELIFVHFHGIDDICHKYGPDSPEAAARIKVIDEYVEALCESFAGDIIITADHGQHKTKDGGGHGTRKPEDMKVPYLFVRRNG